MITDPITVAGLTWLPRPFSAAEHQHYSELAAEHHLDDLAAALEAQAGIGGGTTREKLLAADVKAHEGKLAAYLTDDGAAPRPDLEPAERLEAYELAETIDALRDRADTVKSERIARSLILQNEHLEAVQQVLMTFMHYVLERDGAAVPPLNEFITGLTDDDLASIESVVSAGKLPTGLSALARRERAIYEQARRLVSSTSGSGSASRSTLEPQASRTKAGTKTRSRKSSSRSKPSS